MKHRISTLSLCVSAVCLAPLAPTPVGAQCPPAAVRSLTDASGERWDLNRDGTVVDGTNGAFDGMARLYIGGSTYDSPVDTTMSAMGGRGFTIIVPMPGDPMLTVIRHVYVPVDGSFVRYIDDFQNTSVSSARSVDVEYRTNTGYDALGSSTAEVVTTSDGDTVIEAADRFFVMDNALEQLVLPDGPFVETEPRAFCQVFGGASSRTAPSASSGGGYSCGGMFGSDTSGATVRFSFMVPAGQRVSLMSFAAQGNRASATSSCTTLAALDEALYGDLDNEARMQVINWTLPVDAGSCSRASDCSTGFCVDGQCCNSACGGGDPNDCQACSRAAGAPSNGTCAPATASHVCRGRAGECDRVERCDGSATTCPADAFDTSAVVCRPAVSGCDLREVCTGTNPACPPDRLAFAGTVCESGTGACAPSARCDGTTSVCPAVVTVPDGTLCDDTLPCTFSTCVGGICTPPTGTCDDQDMCTTDMCMGSTCTYAYVPGCIGGRDGGPDSGELFPDGGEMDGGDPFFDGGDPNFDGGPFFDAGRIDGGMDASVPRDADDDLIVGGGGCSCRAAARSSSSSALALLAMLAFALGMRRR